MPTIEHLHAREILDSRARPTISCRLRLSDGAEATVSIPSGASTGKNEAAELRDGDSSRYAGLGVRRAVKNINTTLADLLRNKTLDQSALDEQLIPLKQTVGANATLAVSLAFARAVAHAEKV